MRRTQPSLMLFLALVAMTLMMGLAGCAVGFGYDDPGPEWDGAVVIVGGGGYDRDYHNRAFRPEGGRDAAAGSARGRASMGPRAGGGGHASSGRGHK